MVKKCEFEEGERRGNRRKKTDKERKKVCRKKSNSLKYSVDKEKC